MSNDQPFTGEAWGKSLDDLARAMKVANDGAELMNLFLSNSFPGCSQEEAIRRLKMREEGE